jgi:CubicO group peptidase (beta-lactamase class C family)
MAPTTGFKETFQYQNHMVAAAGYLAARALAPRAKNLGRVYARAMVQRVFRPMGMRSTTLSHAAARRSRNRATPHSQDLETRHHVVPLAHERFVDYVAPSGAVWSTARDMSRYLITELARGVAPGGKRVASEENLTRRWTPQAWRSSDTAYGLGWGIHKTKGLRLITHTGGTMGFATWIGFLPEKGVGVVMISNGTGGHLVEGVTWRRMELWFGVDDKAKQRIDFVLDLQRKEIAKLKKRLEIPDGAWIKPLSGRHENPEIGPVEIRLTKGGYIFDAGEYRTTLMRHNRPDGRTSLMFTNPPLAGLELVLLENKKEGSFELREDQERYVFKQVKQAP